MTLGISAAGLAVVVSDLEGTLTTGETWRGVARYLRTHGHERAFKRFFLKKLPTALLAKARVIDVQAFRDRWIRDMSRLFQGFSTDELARMGEWVVEHELWPQRRLPILAELDRLRTVGHRLVLASGTYQPVLDAFARRLGGEALGTGLEMQDGQATGRLVDWINVGKAKAERLRTALAEAAIGWAYGDTAADVPMLTLSQTPTAVCPDRKLRRAALANGWRIWTEPADPIPADPAP